MEGDGVATLLDSHIGPWTPDDLDLLPEHWKVEILDGTLLVNAQPVPLHNAVARRLTRILEDVVGDDYEPLHEVMLDLGASRFVPDVTVARKDLVAWRAKDQDPAAFSLVVEVASPTTSTFDRTVKAEKYAEAGIRHYWRVDIDPVLTVIALALDGARYAEAGRWTEGQVVAIDEPFRVRFDPAVLRP